MLLENGTVHVEYSVMRNVIESAMKEELGGLFENFQKSTSMINALAEMVHSQPQTPVLEDNTAANGIVNGTAKQKYDV